MAMHRYDPLPNGPLSSSGHRWLSRRIRKLWLLGSSCNCLLFTLTTTALFILLSTQLYLSLNQTTSGSEPSVTSGLLVMSSSQASSGDLSNSPTNLTSYLEEISQLISHRKYDRTAAAISQQLKRVEESLKENRRILQEIRATIHDAHYNYSTLYRHSTSCGEFYATSGLSDGSTSCDALAVNSDIRMEEVYEQLAFDNPDGGVWKQGWKVEVNEQEFRNRKLKVFVVPHSHNDPGWIKTFDTYFREQTKNILTQAVEQLEKHPDMRLIWAETSYLSAWWQTAPSQQHRDLFKKLVRQGRLEIVTGGWVMNDEANTHYFSMLTQLIEGHEWLKDTLGVQPKHSWAIDPFGMSPTMAYLLAGMGFRGMVIQRVHYSIKKYLASTQQLEFGWRQHWAPTTAPQVIAHLEPFYSYDVPHTCGPDPKVCCQFDFKRLPPSRVKCPWGVPPSVITDNNIQQRALLLLDQYRKKSLLYRTNTLLVPLGDDFRFDKAKEWDDQYNNYHRLMSYMNSNSEMNIEVRFGTLQDYFDSILHEQSTNQSLFPSLVGDFFTYCDRDDHYWSGYYTSKPFYKRFERLLASHLRATEILFAWANLLHPNSTQEDPFAQLVDDLVYARQNLALFQHHDGITGTAKDFVVKDYAKRMYRAFTILEQVSSASLHTLSHMSGPVPNLQFMHRFVDDITPPRAYRFDLNGTNQYFVLYNTLGWALESEVFCFEISWSGKETQPEWCLAQGATVIDDLQMNYVWKSVDQIEANKREVCFQPKLGPLSVAQFCIGPECPCPAGTTSAEYHQRKQESFVTLYHYQNREDRIPPIENHMLSMFETPDNITIGNEWIQATFDPNTDGLLRTISLYDGTKWQPPVNVTMALMTYGTRPGGKKVSKSGAYIFLPDQAQPKPFELRDKPKIRLTTGHLQWRYEVVIEQPIPVYLRWTLTRARRSLDFSTEFHLHGLYGANKELLLRFILPSLDNGQRFYTDLNGFQMIARKRFDKIPIQGNVYPLNTMAMIEDRKQRFTVLTGQPLGTVSPESGTVDIFLDRRLSQDDNRGLSQGVMDNHQTREQFRLQLAPVTVPTQSTSPRAPSSIVFESQTLLNPPLGLAPLWQPLEQSSLSLLQNPLPCDLHLLNLRRSRKQPRQFGLWLHRFAFSCESTCHRARAQQEIQLSQLFNPRVAGQLEPSVYPTGFTLLNHTGKKAKSLDDPLQVEPFEIAAFQLHRRL